MRDPIPPPPAWLFNLTKPFADVLSFPTLPYHIHEVLFALFFYQTIQSLVSPVLSKYLFPNIYSKLNTRTRINWDVHVVSLVQSCLINVLALWVMFNDEERWGMRTSPVERIWGYTGASGLIQGLAAGYFLWDLVVSTRYIKVFGVGLLAHAICALTAFSFGFRPFLNYYGPVFILYELSSPFLNIHWFCDKLNLTGSRIQWWNGMLLLSTFFGCRLCWGTYQSLRVYQDVWHALHLDLSGLYRDVHNITNPASSLFVPRDGQLCLGEASCVAAQAEVMKFSPVPVPVWLAVVYMVSNTILGTLNFYWFSKMVETVRKRFQERPDGKSKTPSDGTVGRRKSVVEYAADRLDSEMYSGPEPTTFEKSHGTSMTSGASNGLGEVSRRRT